MTTNTVTGEDHPDYVHQGDTPYVIDGTADLTDSDGDSEGCPFCPLVHILIGICAGGFIFFLGRWSVMP